MNLNRLYSGVELSSSERIWSHMRFSSEAHIYRKHGIWLSAESELRSDAFQSFNERLIGRAFEIRNVFFMEPIGHFLSGWYIFHHISMITRPPPQIWTFKWNRKLILTIFFIKIISLSFLLCFIEIWSLNRNQSKRKEI